MAKLEAAAPTHVQAVRRSLIDHLTPDEVRTLGDVLDHAARVASRYRGRAADEHAPCRRPRSLRPMPKRALVWSVVGPAAFGAAAFVGVGRSQSPDTAPGTSRSVRSRRTARVPRR